LCENHNNPKILQIIEKLVGNFIAFNKRKLLNGDREVKITTTRAGPRVFVAKNLLRFALESSVGANVVIFTMKL